MKRWTYGQHDRRHGHNVKNQPKEKFNMHHWILYGQQVDRMTGAMDTMSKISLKEKFNMHHWISYGRQVDGMTGAMDTMSEICLKEFNMHRI